MLESSPFLIVAAVLSALAGIATYVVRRRATAPIRQASAEAMQEYAEALGLFHLHDSPTRPMRLRVQRAERAQASAMDELESASDATIRIVALATALAFGACTLFHLLFLR